MARGVPCGKEQFDFYRSGAKLKFLISYDWFMLRRRGKKMQPRRGFKKEISYPAVIKSIDCPYISSHRLSPPSSCDSHGLRSRSGQQGLSGEWGYTVRYQDNGSD